MADIGRENMTHRWQVPMEYIQETLSHFTADAPIAVSHREWRSPNALLHQML